VTICPAEGALAMTFAGRGRRVSGGQIAVGVVAVFLVAYIGARVTGHWDSAIPDRVYENLVPMARELDHPR
jgi:hypothetical protein